MKFPGGKKFTKTEEILCIGGLILWAKLSLDSSIERMVKPIVTSVFPPFGPAKKTQSNNGQGGVK